MSFEKEDNLSAEMSAKIRNSLEPAKTVLKLVKAGKPVPLELIETSLTNLKEAFKILR